jgi:hypothetical protein
MPAPHAAHFFAFKEFPQDAQKFPDASTPHDGHFINLPLNPFQPKR